MRGKAEELLSLLRRQQGVLRMTEDDEGRVTITFLVGGAAQSVTVSIYELPDAEPVDGVTPPPDELFASRPSWSELDLLERGLPLYWSREWLMKALMRHQSAPNRVAAQHGYQAAEISRYRKLFGLEGATGEIVRELWGSGAYFTQLDLARHLGVAASTISRHVGSIRHPDSDRIAKVEQMIRQDMTFDEMLAELRADQTYLPRLRYIVSRLRSPQGTQDGGHDPGSGGEG